MSLVTREIQTNFAPHLKDSIEDQKLLERLDLEAIPKHIAIIMDGNGRWAQNRRLPRVAGHRAGIESVREVVETAARLKLNILTLYAFSVENWKRPKTEVTMLMRLLKEFLNRELATLMDNDIKFDTLGRTEELSPSIQRELDLAKNKTSRNHGLLFNVALNYGGRAELVDAFKHLWKKKQNDAQDKLNLNELGIADCLYTA